MSTAAQSQRSEPAAQVAHRRSKEVAQQVMEDKLNYFLENHYWWGMAILGVASFLVSFCVVIGLAQWDAKRSNAHKP